MSPPHRYSVTVSGCVPADHHVHPAVAIAQSSRKPVLCTVPCMVIASPVMETRLSNVFAFRAGLEVLRRSDMYRLLSECHSSDRMAAVSKRWGTPGAVTASHQMCCRKTIGRWY